MVVMNGWLSIWPAGLFVDVYLLASLVRRRRRLLRLCRVPLLYMDWIRFYDRRRALFHVCPLCTFMYLTGDRTSAETPTNEGEHGVPPPSLDELVPGGWFSGAFRL